MDVDTAGVGDAAIKPIKSLPWGIVMFSREILRLLGVLVPLGKNPSLLSKVVSNPLRKYPELQKNP